MIKAECRLITDRTDYYIDPNILNMTVSGTLINRNTQPLVQISIDDTQYPLKAGEYHSTFEIEQDLSIYKIKIAEGDIINVSFYQMLVIKLIK